MRSAAGKGGGLHMRHILPLALVLIGVSLSQFCRAQTLSDSLDGAVIQAHHLQIDKADFLRVAEERFDALEHKRHAANS